MTRSHVEQTKEERDIAELKRHIEAVNRLVKEELPEVRLRIEDDGRLVGFKLEKLEVKV